MRAWSFSLVLSISLASAATFPDPEQGFSNSSILKIRSNLLEIASASWELGTAAEALLELSWPGLSVFNATAFPPPGRLKGTAFPTDVVNIANRTVSQRPSGSLSLIANQGSAADPASLGVSVLLANWTRKQISNHDYSEAATDELTYLLEIAPQSDEGAISHRANEVQLWSDFTYMVPPFLAYFGALKGGLPGRNLLQIAYDQCRLYRDALRDDSGLWRHITLGSFEDKTHWATGNGWAAAGMMRVLSTMNHTSDARRFADHQANLTKWIDEILTESWSHQRPDGGLFNVIDDPKSFMDTSSTALIASVTYRMAVFRNDTSLIPAANRALKLVKNNVDGDGWLQNTVNPITFRDPLPTTEHSPEGQAFLLLLQAAWHSFFLHANSRGL